MLPPKAKVFADDISLQYSSNSPYITYNNSKIIDTSGNNNGHLDPGETVDLVVCLKNWGTQATGVEGKVLCNDSFVVVYDSLADFGDIASGDTATNNTHPFSIRALSNSPMGHVVEFTIIANSNGGSSDTSHFFPVMFKLSQNYPNPFSFFTNIDYTIFKTSDVRLSLFDVSGRCIKTIVNRKLSPGHYTLKVRVADISEEIYFIKLQSHDTSISRKCVILR